MPLCLQIVQVVFNFAEIFFGNAGRRIFVKHTQPFLALQPGVLRPFTIRNVSQDNHDSDDIFSPVQKGRRRKEYKTFVPGGGLKMFFHTLDPLT